MRFFICLASILASICCARAMDTLCLQDAMQKPDGTCMCPANEAGNGDFCCAPIDQGMCQLRGDPVLKSINGEQVYMDYPCTHQVAQIAGTDNGRSCDARVFTAGNFIDKGFIMTTRVAVQVKVGDNPIQYIQIYEYTFKGPSSTGFTNVREDAGPHIITIDGAQFELTYDLQDRFVELRGCGAEVRFRPPQGTDPMQRRLPGVCIISPPDSWAGTVQGGNSCKLTASYSKQRYTSVTDRLLAESIINHMSLPDEQKFDTPELSKVCNGLDGYFQSCTSRKKAEVMTLCGGLMTNTFTRRCLDVLKTNIFLAFCDCIAAYCSRSGFACNRLRMDRGVQNCYPMGMNCTQWV